MIRTICAVLLFMCSLPCLAGDGAATLKGDDDRPTIILTPSAGPGDHLFFEGAEVSLAVNVPETGSENQHIRVVTYLANDRPVARSLKSPYAVKWRPQPGRYTLRARARLRDGSEVFSDQITVMVAKRWGYPDWVQWGTSSPYGGDGKKSKSDVPPPEELYIGGVSSTPKLTVVPVSFPTSAKDEWPIREWIYGAGGFSAYKVTGDIPDEGAMLSLPVGQTHGFALKYITMLQHDRATDEWSVLPTELHLDTDRYAVATARIVKPGVYTVAVVKRLKDEEAVPPIVGKDTESPEISWILPAGGEVITGRSELLVAASDNTRISHVSFLLGENGGNFVRGIDLGGDNDLEDGGWCIDVDFSNYAAGTHTLVAIAEDVAGNRTSASRQIVLDTGKSAPQLTIDPPYYDAEADGVVFKGTVQDDDTVEYEDVVIALVDAEGEDAPMTYNFAHVETDKSGISRWESSLPILPGENVVLISATDAYGNQTNEWMRVSVPLYEVDMHAYPTRRVLQSTSISLEAQAYGGAGPTEYKYEVYDGTEWTLLRDYQVEPDYVVDPDAEPHCAWTAGPPGEYIIRVTARDQGTTEPVVSDEQTCTVVEPLSGVSLSADPASPQPVGTQILLTGSPTGGVEPVCEFEVFDGQEWIALVWKDEWYDLCDYDQRLFVPETPGTYTLKVTAHEIGVTSPAFTDEMTYTITPSEGKDGKR